MESVFPGSDGVKKKSNRWKLQYVERISEKKLTQAIGQLKGGETQGN